jgi:glycosyltransferase involved in cell wall biosynthesis
MQWYKNREGLIDIYHGYRTLHGPRHKLVIAGKPHTTAITRRITALGLEDDVIYVGEVTELELNALYSRALALIFPSLAEGFGWPVLEAQASACPVFTTRALPMSEIGANAARYFDPKDTADAVAVLQEGLRHREEMIRLGLLNSKHYTREAMVHSYVRLYESVLRDWPSPNGTPR